jgi:hypothetical protein
MQYLDHPASTLSGPFLHFERLRKGRFFFFGCVGVLIQIMDCEDCPGDLEG